MPRQAAASPVRKSRAEFLKSSFMWQQFSIAIPDDPEGLEALNHFLATHRVVNTTRELVVRDGVPYWAFLLEYTATGNEESVWPSRRREREREHIDYQQVLSAEEFARFDALRDVRKAIGAELKVKLFTVMTNAELAAIAKANPHTLEELAKVDGVSAERLAKFGEQFLVALAGGCSAGASPAE